MLAIGRTTFVMSLSLTAAPTLFGRPQSALTDSCRRSLSRRRRSGRAQDRAQFKYHGVFHRLGIDVAPWTTRWSSALTSMRAGASATVWKSWRSCISTDERIRFKQLCGTGQKQITFDKVPLAPATEYAGEDADICFRLWLRLNPASRRKMSCGFMSVSTSHSSGSLGGWSGAGIEVDRDYLARLSAEFSRDIQAREFGRKAREIIAVDLDFHEAPSAR